MSTTNTAKKFRVYGRSATRWMLHSLHENEDRAIEVAHDIGGYVENHAGSVTFLSDGWTKSPGFAVRHYGRDVD